MSTIRAKLGQTVVKFALKAVLCLLLVVITLAFPLTIPKASASEGAINTRHSPSSSPGTACVSFSLFDFTIWTDCDDITASTDTASSGCTPNYVYDNLVNKGLSWKVVSQKQDQNNSTSPAQVTFTSTSSTKVTVTDELGLALSADGSLTKVITASVQAHINHSVSTSVTTTIGNSTNFSIPPGETAYADYGVRIQITKGHFYDKARCEGDASDRGTDITYVPIADGWCVWTSSTPPCPSI